MGRKVNPIGFRLKVNRDWDARWFAKGQQFRDLLKEDFAIRRYIKKEGEKAGIRASKSSATPTSFRSPSTPPAPAF